MQDEKIWHEETWTYLVETKICQEKEEEKSWQETHVFQED